MDWQYVREQFPLNQDYAHLSQFYMVSHPRTVRDAIERHRRAIDDNPYVAVERGMFGSASERLLPRVYDAAARYIGGRPDEIALVPNTTTGLALVYHGLSLKQGDEILTTEHDHFSQHEAIRLATQKVGATYRKIALADDITRPRLREMLARIRAEIRPATRALGVTWVLSSYGVKLPIRAIARVVADVNEKRRPGDEVLLIVDGTHGLGAAPEAAAELGADFFISSTHKWMFGPRGTGIVHAARPTWARIQPTIPTYANLDLYRAWIEGRQPGATRAAYVSPGGFLAYEYQWAMTEAFEFHQSLGRRRIAARITELNTRLKRGLLGTAGVTLHTPMREQWSAGMACFDIKGVAAEDVVQRLYRRRIVASTTPYRNPCARLAAGIMNTEAEVDRAIAAVAELARIGALPVAG